MSRPFSKNPLSEVIQVRLSSSERAVIIRLAVAADKTVSAFVRSVLTDVVFPPNRS